MFKRPLKLCTTSSLNVITALLQQESRFATTAGRSVITQTAKWDLVSAVCLERLPVIVPSMNEIEIRFKQMLDEVEFERSFKSDHELRVEDDQRHAELVNKGVEELEIEAVKQTAQDFEDACQDEINQMQLAPRITEADEKNDTRSIKRKLDRNLVLLVEQKLGEKSHWIPPQGIRKEGETMRQAAERVLREACGEGLNVKFYGNAPIGFYKYKYPKEMRQEGSVGAKVFYFQAKHLNGNVTEQVKYQWLDRAELSETLPEIVHKSVSQFLVSE